MEHIKLFSLKISHYSSQPVKYLDSGLNITIMYDLFKKKYPDSEVKYSYYYKVYRENFGFRFGRPQVDTCECERLNLKLKDKELNPIANRVAAAELLVHKRRSNKFYSSLWESTALSWNKKNIACLIFDNMSLPSVPILEMNYLQQLSMFPFSVHDTKKNKAMFFLYHEGEAKKGPNKVCSFLHEYILIKFLKKWQNCIC